MNLFGVGPTEIFVVLIVILVLFGPDRLPELAKKIGGASREIRENLNAVNEQMNTALETSMELDKARMIAPVETPPPTPGTPGPSDETILPPFGNDAPPTVSDDSNAEIPPPLPDTLAR
jgi:sec-independent protein translocase protein TatA